MSLLDTLRKNLSSELFAQVTDALGDDFNNDLVPRSRLNKVIGQRDDARQQLAQLTQGSDPDDDDDDPDDGDGSTPAGGTPKQKKSPKGGLSQKDIDEAVRLANEAKDTEMKNLRLQFAATAKLRDAKFVDPDLVLSSKLIDFSKVTTDEAGNITGGLDDQITQIAKDRPYLVNAQGGQGGKRGTGKDGGTDDFAQVTSREEFLKLSTEKQLEFKKANPEVFRGFMANL